MEKVCNDSNNTTWCFDEATKSYFRLTSEGKAIRNIRGEFLPDPEILAEKRRQIGAERIEATPATKSLWRHWNGYTNN